MSWQRLLGVIYYGGLTAIVVVAALVLLSAVRVEERIVYRQRIVYRPLPPISQTSTKAQVERHFHFGKFGDWFRVPGGSCYRWGDRRHGWQVTECSDETGGPPVRVPAD